MKTAKVEIRFNMDSIKPFYVIVETYSHKNYGHGKRAYLKEFTRPERKLISAYHAKIYSWYMRTGIPRDGVVMSMNTYNLLQRAANFFYTI